MQTKNALIHQVKLNLKIKELCCMEEESGVISFEWPGLKMMARAKGAVGQEGLGYRSGLYRGERCSLKCKHSLIKHVPVTVHLS